MCHGDDSRPPGPEHPGEVASRTELELTAADGNELMAYAAHPAAPPRGQPSGTARRGIVILPDVRGLHAFYRDLAVRFAEAGLDAVAVDYFGRTTTERDRTEAFDVMPHVQQTTPHGVAADVAAGVGYLRSAAGGAASAVFTVGFCFGGGYSWRQSADQPGLAGAIGFYGRPDRAMEAADRLAAPLLLLVAGADQHIAVDDVRAVADAAQGRGLEADLVVYSDAPHSFFDRTAADHQEACADAWRRILDFVERHG